MKILNFILSNPQAFIGIASFVFIMLVAIINNEFSNFRKHICELENEKKGLQAKNICLEKSTSQLEDKIKEIQKLYTSELNRPKYSNESWRYQSTGDLCSRKDSCRFFNFHHKVQENREHNAEKMRIEQEQYAKQKESGL